MKRKTLIVLVVVIIVLCCFGKIYSKNKIEKVMFEHAKEINSLKIKYDSKLNKQDLATNRQLKERIYWLKYYSKELSPKGYNWKRMWKDAYCIVWLESNFVNYIEHDEGDGFGFIAMKWTTAKEIAKNHSMAFNKLKIQEGSKRQAEYLIRYLVWLYNFYGKNRRKAITGYNVGTGLSENYIYREYWLKMSGRINELDKWLK